MRVVETMIKGQLTPESYILQQRAVVLLLYRTSIKNFEKRRIQSETFATWKYWKDSRIVRGTRRTVAFSFLYCAGSNRILGNDKGVGVPVLQIVKKKIQKSDPEWKGNIVLGRQGLHYTCQLSHDRFSLRRCVRLCEAPARDFVPSSYFAILVI